MKNNRPLVFHIFWLTMILGVLYPVILIIRVWVNYSAIHWLELNPHTPPTDISWFDRFLLILDFKDIYAAAKALFFWLLGVLPAAFALWHFRTIELLHRSLYAEDMPPSVIPTYEQTPSLADPADRSPPPKTWLNDLRLIAYHSYRIWKWYWGIIANPTFGAFLRVVLVKLPDSKLLALFPSSRTTQQHKPFQYNMIELVFNSILVILLFSIWLFWPLIPKTWNTILDDINLNKFSILLCALIIFFYFLFFLEKILLSLNRKRIFERAQIYVELSHLLESSDKKEEIRAALEKQVRKHEEKQSLHSINRESLFEVFNAQEKIENYFRVQQELPEFSEKGSLIFFLNHVVLGRMVSPSEDKNDNPPTWQVIFESSARTDLPVFKRIACYTPERVKKIFRKHCGKQCSLLNPKFLCPVKVKSGFLSPTYLVSGLLSEFDENWQLIVRNYGLDMDCKKDPLLRGKDEVDKFRLLKLRKLQSFIWMCWIQWGPSIPMHGSDNWKKGSIGLQYGYGDENNSLPVFLKDKKKPENRLQWEQLKNLYRGWQNEDPDAASSNEQSVVIPTSLSAELVWVKPHDNEWNVCKAQEKNESFLALEANLNTESGTSNIQPNWHESRMYSAYVWVIFAVCVKKPEKCKREGEKKVFPDLIFPWDESKSQAETAREKQAWRGLIPFFQHGNIAEPTVYESIKKELAYKTLQTLKDYLHPEVQLDDGILGISFVCAFDENGDGSPSQRSAESMATRDGKTIREHMDNILESSYKNENWTYRLNLEEHAVPQIASCRMPMIVEQYFQSIRLNSLIHDELRDENHWRDLRDLTEETSDENSLGENILKSAYKLPMGCLERERLEQLKKRLWGEKKADAPETHFLVFGKNLDTVSECKVLGCLVIEWYPNSECGRFSDLVVDRDFRRQGIARELIWRGAEILRKCAKVSGKELKMIFAQITNPQKPDSDENSMAPESPIEAFRRLGAKKIPIENDFQPSLGQRLLFSKELMLVVFDPVSSQPKLAIERDLLGAWILEFYTLQGCVENRQRSQHLIKQGLMSLKDPIDTIDL